MKFQALYRKYRPKNFDEVVGQKVTIQILKNAIENNHISHAYLFYGPRGTGKTSIAKILSRTINCESPKDGVPCEKCDSCKISIEPGCVDIIEIDAASNNGVDEIRELKNKISFVPSELKYKVYIVDEVHMLSTGAFNALLKTLEEPPEHAIFVLATTELQKVPLTIISRCQTLEFRKIDTQSMTQKLKEISIKEKIDIDDNALLEIAKYSNGGLRDAIGLLEKAAAYTDKTITSNIIKEISGNVSEEDLNNFITLFQNKDIEQLIIKINDFYNEGIDLLRLANNIIEYLRDEIIVNKHYDRSLCKLINELDQMVTLMEKSENPKIIFEVTIINCLLDEEPKVEQAKEIKTVEEKKTEPKKEIEEPTEPKKNDDNIIDIRVGNTLYNPQKAIISEIRRNWDQIKDLAFDEQYGNVARLLSSDTMPVAASDTNIILVSKLKGIATQINGDVETVNEIINKTFNREYMVVCLSEDDWKKYTAEYKDNKDKFKYQEEPKIEKTNKSLKDRAKELFD